MEDDPYKVYYDMVKLILDGYSRRKEPSHVYDSFHNHRTGRTVDNAGQTYDDVRERQLAV